MIAHTKPTQSRRDIAARMRQLMTAYGSIQNFGPVRAPAGTSVDRTASATALDTVSTTTTGVTNRRASGGVSDPGVRQTEDECADDGEGADQGERTAAMHVPRRTGVGGAEAKRADPQHSEHDEDRQLRMFGLRVDRRGRQDGHRCSGGW